MLTPCLRPGSGEVIFDPMNEVTHILSAIEQDDPAAYLDKACAGNPQLRAEVEALLRADSKKRAATHSGFAVKSAII